MLIEHSDLKDVKVVVAAFNKEKALPFNFAKDGLQL